MMEILYRAAKQDGLKEVNIAFQGLPKVKAVFEYLVAKPLQVPLPWLYCAFMQIVTTLYHHLYHLYTDLQPGL